MDNFFYNLNDKLNAIRATPEVTHQQLNERDMSRAAKGYEKYGREGMEALAKAGREGKALDPIRNKYDKYDHEQVDEKIETFRSNNSGKMANTVKQGRGPAPSSQATRDSYAKDVRALRASGGLKKDSSGQRSGVAPSGRQIEIDNFEEGMMDTVKSVGKKVASGINKLVGHGSDEDMRRDVQRKAGAPVTGKKPEQKTTEAAKYRDPKYKDKLYTQEPPDYTYGPDYDDAYDNPKPDDYAGRKRKIGGSEFDHNDPLVKGFGRSGTGSPVEKGPRKGLPTRNQISSLKGSIKAARGTHAEPNLPEAGAPMTAKQKSFAALAPPANKITFADKIAGAKKEVDEMLGDVAAEAMRNALSPKQKKIDMNKNGKLDANDFAMLRKGGKPEMDEERSKGTAFDMNTPRAAAPKVGSIERGHKHDIKHTATGRMVTRRTDDQGISVGSETDDEGNKKEKRTKAGRPDGSGKKIGAKGPSGKSKLMTREGDVSTGNLQKMHQLVNGLRSYVQDPDGQAMLKELMSLVKHYVNQSNEKPVDEEKTSTRDDHAERAGKKVTKDIEYDEKKKDGITGKKRGPEDDKAEKAGKKVAKDIEHDEKKKDKEVDESTTAGSVATSTATKGSGGGMVGKGIYDSMNRELENMIAESMSINMSDSTEGGKSLTITATDEDALKLGMMLKNAGLGGGDAHGDDMHSPGEEACDTCGMQDCGCGDVQQAVDENAPDYPTNTEQADNNFGYAGGLNKPKTDVAGDGQTTVPNTAVHTQDEDALRRMMEMAGIKQAELEPWEQTMKEDAVADADAAEDAADEAEDSEEVEEDFLESIQRMREIAGIREAKKPDFLDMDKDGDKKEPMSKAVKDKEEKKVDESIFALTNQWKAYKG